MLIDFELAAKCVIQWVRPQNLGRGQVRVWGTVVFQVGQCNLTLQTKNTQHTHPETGRILFRACSKRSKRFVGAENQNNETLGKLDWQASKIDVDGLDALSRLSEILVARAAKLNKCENLHSFGKTEVVCHCSALRLIFGVNNSSKCGGQPRSKPTDLWWGGYT